MRPFKRSASIILSAGLLFSLSSASFAAPVTSYTSPVITASGSERIAELKPLWTADSDASSLGISATERFISSIPKG